MKKIASAAVLALAMGGAAAQVYVEGAFGMTNLDYGCSGTYSCDNDDTGVKLLAGFKLNRNLAIEVGYLNFGEAQAGVYGVGDLSLKSTAFYGAIALRGELAPKFSGVARIGLASVESELDTFFGSESESAASALFGVGLEYAVTKNASITGAIDFTQSAEVGRLDSGTLRMISVGLKLDF